MRWLKEKALYPLGMFRTGVDHKEDLIRFCHYKFIFDLMLFDLVHGDSVDAFAVEYFELLDLETGESPGVTFPEEDVDSGS